MNYEIGDLGEKIAVKHLISLGFTHVLCNTRHAGVELDIVCMKDSVLHIVEVKSTLLKNSLEADLYNPLERIDSYKYKRLVRAALFLEQTKHIPVKIMAVSVKIDTLNKKASIEMYDL